MVSNKLVSLMLAQASENEHLAAIFDDLLDEQGSEIYMRPVEDYVAIDRAGDLLHRHRSGAAARRSRHRLPPHARRTSPTARNLGGVVVNPEKSEALTYEPADRIIVLARD